MIPDTFLSRERSGVSGPLRFGRKVLRPDRGDGLDLQLDAARFQSSDDRGRKAMPAGFARAGDIEDASALGKPAGKIRHIRLQDLCGRISDHPCRCRRADLVRDDPQFLSLFRQPRDGPQEIRALRGVDPGGANNQVRSICRPNRVFAGELAHAVDRQGAGRAIRMINVEGAGRIAQEDGAARHLWNL